MSRYEEIETFVNTVPPQAIVKEVDLDKYITRVVRNGPLVAVSLTNITSKAVLVEMSGTCYAVKEPNPY